MTAAIAIAVAIVFYSVTVTATADPAIRPFATALAIALLVALLLNGLIDVGRAKDGLLASALSLLPNIFRWGNTDGRRASLVSVVLVTLSIGAVWLGPLGTRSLTIACDEAAEVAISPRSDRLKCDGAVAKSFWLTPLQRLRTLGLQCFDARSNSWSGALSDESNGQCGARPIDASFVSNGIILPEHDTGTVAGRRMALGISRLSVALDAELPNRRFNDRLLFATWNIRDLGEDRFGYGTRLPESYAFIAEVISYFDIVAIQELHDGAALQQILNLLGGDYRAEFSLVSVGAAGNNERLGFVYDARKVAFGDVSTTVVLPQEGITHTKTGQPARPPFLAEFIINGRRFFVATSHIFYGMTHGPRFENRITELRSVASGINGLMGKYYPEHPVVFAGDLNVSVVDGREMAALTENGFETDRSLAVLGSSHDGGRPYDQIMIRSAKARELAFGRFGVFNVFAHVFRDEDQDDYRIDLRRIARPRVLERDDPPERFYKQARTFQISDHRVKWAEFRVDW